LKRTLQIWVRVGGRAGGSNPVTTFWGSSTTLVSNLASYVIISAFTFTYLVVKVIL
jgi:hypothetical protein